MNLRVNPSAQKVILIGTSLGENPVHRHFAALGRGLTEFGYRVLLLAHGPEDDRSYVDPRIPVLRWPSARPTGLPDALFFARLLRQYRPSCVLSNFGSINIMTLLGALYRVPVRVIWHHTLSSQISLDSKVSALRLRLQRLRAKMITRLATHLVGNSNAAKQDLVENFRIPASRCQVFWNCLADPENVGWSPRARGKTNGHRFLCVGRFHPSKGQDVVVRALASVVPRLHGVQVEFIGNGTRQQSCEQLASELGIASHCVFSGRLPHDEVLRRMASAWATIVPSQAEAFGLVCIESLAVGVPVIGSRTGGIPEIIRDGVDGLLFPPGDHAALARQMVELCDDDRGYLKMASECRQRFLENFELSKAVAAQASWLDAMIGGPISQIRSGACRSALTTRG